MWLLDSLHSSFRELPFDSPLLIQRGRDGVPDDQLISRTHTRLERRKREKGDGEDDGEDEDECVITHVGRHPIYICRFANLATIGWVLEDSSHPAATSTSPVAAASSSHTARSSHTLTRSKLSSSLSHFEILSRDGCVGSSSTILHRGDAFAISTEHGLQPFWIIGRKEHDKKKKKKMNDERNRIIQPPSTPSLSLTPPHSPIHQPSSPPPPAAAPHINSAVDPIDHHLRIDAPQDNLDAAARHERDKQQREQSLWSPDQYPESKRRKLYDSTSAPNARIETHNETRDLEHNTKKSIDTTTTCGSSHPPTPTPTPAAPDSSSSRASFHPPTPTSLPAATSTTASRASSPSIPTHTPAPVPVSHPPTLVMQPLSVFDFHFSTEKANPLCHAALKTFFAKHTHETQPNLRITMVLSGSTPESLTGPARDVWDYFTSHPVDARFDLRIGDITALTALGVRATYMVHPTTWRFVGGEGGRIARYMHPTFVDHLIERYPKGAQLGTAYVTHVPQECELAKRCAGLISLLTLTPPNMNPSRPNSLNGDYMKGCKALTTAYNVLFLAFEAKLKATNHSASNSSPHAPIHTPHTLHPPAVASAVTITPISTAAPLVIASRSPSPAHAPPPPGAATSPNADNGSSSLHGLSLASIAPAAPFVPPTVCPSYTKPDGIPKAACHFTRVLYKYIEHPRDSMFEPYIFWEDSEFVVIYDVYPKARIHLLLLPKRQPIGSIAKLTSNDLPLLRAMDARGKWLCDTLSLVDSHSRRIPLRRGFHAIPSLHLLHLHIISQEFESSCLKHKKHWNSFVTSFFIQPNQLIEMINKVDESIAANAAASKANFFHPTSSSSSSSRPSSAVVPLADQLRTGEKLLSLDLRCHRIGCAVRCSSMTELRTHLNMCTTKPYPQQTSNK